MTANFLNVAQQVGSSGTVLVTGAGTAVNTTGQFPNIVVGQDGSASLTIADQAVVNTTNMDVALNHDIGVTDTLDINHGTLTVGQGITIGDAGTSVATVENGGVINVNANTLMLGNQATGNGSLTVSGAGSALDIQGVSSGVNVGFAGTGSLTLAAGAALTADFLNIGQLVGSSGTVLITGAGTTVDTTAGQFQNILLGQDGSASLTVADHAVVTTTNMEVANDHQNGVTDTLVIDDATLNVLQGLSIGVSGTASATVEDGGTLSANFIGLAQQAGSSADLTVTGVGSSVSTPFMQVNGGATLHVANGGKVTVNGMDDEGAVSVNGGTLDVEGQLTGAGTITLSNGASLVLGTSTTFAPISVTSANSTLRVAVDNDVLTVSGDGNTISETGNNESLTLNGNNDTVSLTGTNGTINVAGGNAAITLLGTSDQVNVTSAITGAANGISLIQNGAAGVTISAPNAVTGQSGNGILAEVSSSGSGNIVVNATGSVSGSGTGSDGILAMNLNAANGGNVTVTATGGVSGTQNAIQASTNGTGTVSVHAGGNINATGQPVTGQGQFGIRAINDGTGSISLVTDAGTVINSGGEGVSVLNRNTNIPVNANASITATVNGTVNFGAVPNPSGSPAKGIDVGFFAGGNDNPNVHGTVVLNNNANVTQTVGSGGNAVTAYSYGDGSVTLNEGAGTVVSAGQIGVAALGLSAGNSFTGGANDVIVNVGDNARITGIASFGLQAYDSGDGNVSLTTGNGDIINGGSDGILASNSAKSVSAGHTITVNVGTDTVNSSTRFGINAGYNPANASAINVANGNGNVHGDVFLTSNATVTAVNNAVNGFNWGTGNVTVVTGSASSENSSTASGIFAGAFDGGNVSLTNGGSATGKTGLTAQAAGSGNITIENDGTATGTQFSGITVNQNAAGAIGSTTITNTGTVTGTGNSSAINVNENATGTVTFNNSGTIGPAVINSSTNGFTVNGGSQITINNTGHINGHIVTGTNGVIAANTTINNQAGAVWQTSFVTDEGTIVATGSTISVFSQPGNGMVVGNTGNAHLTLQAGAVMTANFLNVAQQVGSSGTVLVTGAGTAVNTTGQFPNIVVGQDGTASLTIADQAVVNTTNMSVGVDHQNGVTDTLIVDHATLNSTNGISIGEVGTANATVENGGAVHVGFISLGDQATGVASLTIDGAGSVVTTNGLNLGVSGGSATLTVSHGGAVDIGLGTTTVADAVHVGNSASLQGSGTINGNVVDDGNVAATTGMLDITGAVTGSGSLSIAAGAHLEVGSSVSSTATVIFQGATGSLVLDHAAGQTINFSGFTGDGTLSGSNQIDLKDINYNSASFSETFDQATNTVTVSDGTNSTTLHFAGNYVPENFKFTSDGANGTIVYDPPVPSSTPAIGGAPSVGTPGFNFADHASPIVQTVEHVVADIIKPEVAAIKGLLGGFAGNGTTASLIDHLAAAADGQLGDKTILTHHDFHLS
jgi:T5SS/PEP-CTERM-associated repeat protein